MLKIELCRAVGAIGLIGGILGLTGCGSSADGDALGGISASKADALSGVYELTRFTENAAGCDVEGPSILETVMQRNFVLAPWVVLGQRVVQLASCTDLEDCRGKADAIRTGKTYFMEYSCTLSSEIDGARVAGFRADTGFGRDGGMCTERTYSDHLLTLNGSSVRLETRTKLLSDRPQEDGFCVVTPAESRSEAAALPCAELQVLEGTRIDDAG